MTDESTIVALATPEGSGGLAVVRLSGPDAITIARRVFRGREFGESPASHKIVYGILSYPVDSEQSGCEIDRCLALPLRAPRSYTGEDTVEFHCHGGRAVARQALAACRLAGAVPAGPGEFTRRAFLNGKLSLDQAEAVADLVAAEGEQAARAALSQLRGGLDDQLREVETPLLDLLARIEGSFEFVDEDGVDLAPSRITAEIEAAVAAIDRLLAMAPAGRLLRDGVQVVLAGPVNAGKSALFNALLGEDRAIVDAEAGTTRDVVSARVVRDGVVYVLHDTAGLREGSGRIEGKGIARTQRQVAAADLVLAVADKDPPTVLDTAAPVITVRAKADLGGAEGGGFDAVTSSVTGAGIADLWARLAAEVARRGVTEAVAMGVVLNERHAARLASCRGELVELTALARSEAAGATEVLGTMLGSILGRLGEVSGRVFSEHLLDAVFRKFCVGK